MFRMREEKAGFRRTLPRLLPSLAQNARKFDAKPPVGVKTPLENSQSWLLPSLKNSAVVPGLPEMCEANPPGS